MAGEPVTGPRFKDHFSGQAAGYARFRPGYPEQLFAYLCQAAPGPQLAWDCATGSGQAALGLARHVPRVVATDASEQQLSNATEHPRVTYGGAPAERSGLPDHSVDLVTVAQALHWFDLDRFYAEVRRVTRPGGLLAVWTYNLLTISPALDPLVNELYWQRLAGHWPPERRWVDQAYAGLAFPFDRLEPPPLAMEASWTLEQLLGFLGTWSAVRRCIAAEGDDPVDRLRPALARAWGSTEHRQISWPLTLWVGVVSGE